MIEINWYWVILIAIIIIATAISIYMIYSSNLSNGDPIPTNIILKNKSGQPLEGITMWDSNGNVYNITESYQWLPNNTISFALAPISDNGSYQFYCANLTEDNTSMESEYMFNIISIQGKVFIEYLYNTPANSIEITATTTAGTYTPVQTFTNRVYTVTGTPLTNGVSAFPAAVRFTNNTGSGVNSINVSYFYVMDSDNNEYLDLENGATMYPDRKSSQRYDSSGNPITINLNKPIQLEFTVPITNNKYAIIYIVDTNQNDYTIVMLNKNNKVYITYPCNLHPSAFTIVASTIGAAAIEHSTSPNPNPNSNEIQILSNSPNSIFPVNTVIPITVIQNQDLVKKKVIVIGAGLAGMTSAQLLLDNGFDVQVLEARNRIGGRLWTSSDIFSFNGQGVPIDVGASWIHGDRNQPLMYLKGKGNIDVWDDAEMRYIFSNGVRMPQNQQSAIESAKNTVWHWLEDQGVAPSDYPQLTAAGQTTIKGVMEANRSFVIMDTSGNTAPGVCTDQCGKIAYNDIWQRAADNSGSNLSDLGAPGFTVGQPVVGKELIVIKGNSQMINAVSTAETQFTNVTLNVEVSNINYSDPRQVVVTDTKRNTYTADYVICTIPLGVLQKPNKVADLFTPDWPASKVASMGKMGFGLLTKYFMIFPYSFWSAEEQIVLLPVDPTSYVYFPSVETAKSTGVINDTDLNDWLTQLTNTQLTLVNFERVTTNYGKVPMLVATFPADLGWIAERIYANDLATNRTRLTDMIYTRLQNAFSTWWTNNIPETPPVGVTTAIPRPTKVYCTPWSTETYTMGAYSYIATGGGSTDVENVAAAIGNNKVQFAGEHTDRQYIATMAAAFRSGYTAVNNILVDCGKTAITIPGPAPIPTNVTAVGGDASATVSFTGSPLATSYTIVPSYGTVRATGATSPIVISGLQAGTYTFTVYSNNNSGGSSSSQKSNSVYVS
jgi:monoamine oxidase